jgi:WD repeat-containing protein 48
LLSSHLTLPSSTDAPSLSLPPNVSLIVSEDGPPGWATIYRGTVASTGHDMGTLEDVLPLWLLEYLLMNKAPLVPIIKIGFVLLPWPNKDPDGEQLPELLNTSVSITLCTMLAFFC